MLHGEFRDARLVAVYDAEFGWAHDDDFFLALVDEKGPAARVLDLGCGTGRLALGMAAAGHTVTEALSTAAMRFRSEGAVRSSLHTAGFTVERIYGGWHRDPVGADDGDLLVVASTWDGSPQTSLM